MIHHTPKCFASHMGAWAICSDWIARALSAVRLGTLQPKAFEDGGSTESVAREKQFHMANGTSKVVFDERRKFLYSVYDGVGIVFIDGPMMKFDSKYGGTNTIRTRRAVRMAADDRDAKAVILKIDSPGGTVAGTTELAADVAALAKQKKTVAYIEDLGASAAYWVAAAAGKIFANEMALVGSIGAFSVIEDSSKAADMQGVKIHVLSTGPLKGAGVPGAPVTDEMLAKFQGIVDAFGDRFFSAVKQARKFDARGMQAVTTGEVWIARKALQLGLIDGIRSFDWVLNYASGRQRHPELALARERILEAMGVPGEQWRRTMQSGRESQGNYFAPTFWNSL